MKPDQPSFLSRRIVVAIFVVLSAGTAIALRGKWQGNEMNALLFAVMIGAVATNSQTAKAQGETALAPSNDVTAIDILLEPDAVLAPKPVLQGVLEVCRRHSDRRKAIEDIRIKDRMDR